MPSDALARFSDLKNSWSGLVQMELQPSLKRNLHSHFPVRQVEYPSLNGFVRQSVTIVGPCSVAGRNPAVALHKQNQVSEGRCSLNSRLFPFFAWLYR